MLRQKAFYGILKRNIHDFSSVNTADYISAFTNDIKLIEDNYIIPSLMVLQYAVMFIVTLILLFEISPLIAMCLIGCMVVMFVLPGLMGKSLQIRQEMLSKQFSVFTSRLKDFFSGYEVIKSFQITNHIKNEFVNENHKVADVKYKTDKLFALNEGISGILAYFTQFSGLFIGGYLIIQGNITPGTLVALIQLSGTFVSPVMMILQNVPKIKSIVPIIKRMEELAEYMDTSFVGTLEPSFLDRIVVKDLSFAYEENRPILMHTNLTLQTGKKYAIVGKSGCGKTTLVKLLMGYYSSYTGDITYDGTSLRDLNIEKIQNMASVIHQSIYMFDDSIRQNICLYDIFEDKDLNAALITSGVDQFLRRMPDGLWSKVGENGSNLSGGQRQRVAVARALIRHKPILVLDEGTSAVDMQTAYDMESSLLAIKDLTLITITHSLSADLLGQYDQIIYMEDGAVAEIGSLPELLSKQGGFCDFVNRMK
jgi:ABC-type multidrug transport system fused ATPase/permease subunit